MIFSSTKNLHDGYYYYYYSVLLVRKVNVVFLQTVDFIVRILHCRLYLHRGEILT